MAAVSSHRRFAVMDGLRGIAAMGVMVFHSFANGNLVRNGGLAVDLFFILSGFVIAYSYEGRLSASMGTIAFVETRLKRLYPMLLVGAVGGILVALIHNMTHHAAAYPLGPALLSGALSLALLPYLGAYLDTNIFSFNPPIWSLFFEMVANVAYAIFCRRLTTAVLAGVIVVSLAIVVFGDTLGGNAKATFLGGFPRVAAGFFGGVLLHRLWSTGRLPAIKANIFVLGTLLLAILCLPVEVKGWIYLPVFAALFLIVWASIADTRSAGDGWCEFMGLISYPVYLVHWITLYLFTFVGTKIGLGGGRYWVVVVAHTCLIPFIGFLLAKYYETPVRKMLRPLSVFGPNKMVRPAPSR